MCGLSRLPASYSPRVIERLPPCVFLSSSVTPRPLIVRFIGIAVFPYLVTIVYHTWTWLSISDLDVLRLSRRCWACSSAYTYGARVRSTSAAWLASQRTLSSLSSTLISIRRGKGNASSSSTTFESVSVVMGRVRLYIWGCSSLLICSIIPYQRQTINGRFRPNASKKNICSRLNLRY